MSIMLNGGPIYFFGVSRGLKQGDLLSPILFILAQDVLSRNIHQLVMERKIQPIVIRNGIHPTHLMFADDIFLFCNGDGTSETRKRQIATYFQMDLSAFPDKYLGVFLAQGKMKSIRIWYLVDYMHLRLASWSGKILNFQARLTLYGNAEERKCITLKWDNVCTSKKEGCLGIRKLEDVNKALLMKLLWKILNCQDEWANFFLAKYMDKNGKWITFYRKSSVWNGIRWVLPEFIENTKWIVGNGAKVSLWNDRWIFEEPICRLFPNHPYIAFHPYLKVQELIVDNHWCFHEGFFQFFIIDQLPVLKEGEDFLIWSNTHSGVFTVSDAINKIRLHQPKLHWYKKIWNPAVLPSTSASYQAVELAFSAYTAMVEFWFLSNEIYYDDVKPVLSKIQGTENEKSILQFFNIQVRKIRRTRIIEIFFYLPNENDLLLCCDGAARGNPGNAGYGFVVRNHVGAFIFAESGGLGITTNYVAEFISCIKALEWEVEQQSVQLILQSDSSMCVTALQKQKLHWLLLARWQKIMDSIYSITFRHAYREVNFSADHFAKKGTRLQKGQIMSFNERPSNLQRLESPGQPYYRFV
ncbi:uncharacterized protein LOC113350825 [Papaver somniferum]|uniref:uncharacterized protein LOC113350825 n=1 Tax=Papaver somniferum TaxID=3469 RepID=UPI000E705903|nr:uncharacterized protein LOC113350825 [Papaver somniferum]